MLLVVGQPIPVFGLGQVEQDHLVCNQQKCLLDLAMDVCCGLYSLHLGAVFLDLALGDFETQPGLLQFTCTLLLSPNKLLVVIFKPLLLDGVDCLLDTHDELLRNTA